MAIKKQQEIVFKAQEGKQKMALDTKADVMIYGGAAGSGKSRLILLKALKYAAHDPNFEGVLFRRTSPPLRGAGGLFTEAKKLYSQLRPRIREKDMEVIFEQTKGGTLKFTHLENEGDAEGNHQGLQYSMVAFDELTHFTQTQFLYLLGRLRSASETDSFCMASTNPDPDSWVLSWVEWYLDEEGYPREDRCGQIRYFVIVEDKPVFADTAEELALEYPDLCYVDNDNTGERVYVPPMTFCFINGNIFDNPELIRANPKYLSNLKAQTKIQRARLLDGNWLVRPEGANVWDRNWLHKKKLSELPSDFRTKFKFVRAWDKAYSEPSDTNRHPDFTASVKMAKDREGNMYIFGDYDDQTLDEKTMVYGRFRKRPGDRDSLILAQATIDDIHCTVILPKDPAAGVVEYTEAAKKLNQLGFKVKPDPTPSNQKKMIRFMPFSSACQNGSVYIVEESFPNKATLEAFYKELESFNGERSTANRKDDWADSAASAYNALCKETLFTAVKIPSVVAPTIKSRRKR